MPIEIEEVPLIMIAAGAGISPFRGFIQGRAAQVGKKKLPPAVLYYGCREAGRDDLYHEEFAEWEKLGAIKVHWAYSRASDGQKKYVQDVLLENRAELRELWKKKAKIFVCGSRRINQAVEKAAMQIKKEEAESRGESLEEAKIMEWWDALRNDRYVADVFD
jgi:cytochrome P450 / NADPH-cytochrome P450 reductase